MREETRSKTEREILRKRLTGTIRTKSSEIRSRWLEDVLTEQQQQQQQQQKNEQRTQQQQRKEVDMDDQELEWNMNLDWNWQISKQKFFISTRPHC